MKTNKIYLISIFLLFLLFISGCGEESATQQAIDRESKIPSDAVKMTPQTDAAPVKSHSSEYYDPVPVPYPINTAGGEDSSFVLPDGNTLYIFFTPDVSIPAEKQVIDGVTGIYVSKKQGDAWSKPERVVLQDKGKLSLEGCEFVQGNTIWFCAAREGYTGIHWFTAEYKDNRWQDWKNADFPQEYEVGELHFSSDWNKVYFHSSRAGGKGGLDIWMSTKNDGEWQEPVNVEAVNTADNEGWPALNPAEDELWIYKNYGLWRSKRVNGEWQEPEQMFSPLAGEATIDSAGNVYFTHHFFENSTTMIEADIYVARKE
ncbi:MAG: hypothetical protein KJ574_01725 [Nanoarchaeota archaeon]|nr:hypothetical protein [Nanoarchaeota archaeon]